MGRLCVHLPAAAAVGAGFQTPAPCRAGGWGNHFASVIVAGSQQDRDGFRIAVHIAHRDHIGFPCLQGGFQTNLRVNSGSHHGAVLFKDAQDHIVGIVKEIGAQYIPLGMLRGVLEPVDHIGLRDLQLQHLIRRHLREAQLLLFRRCFRRLRFFRLRGDGGFDGIGFLRGAGDVVEYIFAGLHLVTALQRQPVFHTQPIIEGTYIGHGTGANGGDGAGNIKLRHTHAG